MNVQVSLYSCYWREPIKFIPLAYCRLDSLDIFTLFLVVLRPYLKGILFDLILKFRAGLTLSFFYHFLVSLGVLSFGPCVISVACVHFYADVCERKLVCKRVTMCVCECSWMTGQGLWTLRPGWRIERPLEALWKPLQPTLTPSGGRGAREGRSKPVRRGQEVKVKQKIRGESPIQGSIYGLGRIFKRVSAVSKDSIKSEKSVLLRNTGYSRRKTGWNALRG